MGSNRLSVEAAAREARRQGLRPLVLTTRLEGEAREVARVLVAVLRECVESGRPAAPPVCLLAGGETTVTVRGDGQGGPEPGDGGGRGRGPCAASRGRRSWRASPPTASTGRSDAAGGIVDDRTASRAAALGLAPAAAFLAASDTRNFLGPLGDLIVTGPTGTNVVDLVALLAWPRPRAGAIIAWISAGEALP